MNGAWLVEWTEREKGWGSRPDGCWYYESKEEANLRTSQRLDKIRQLERDMYGSRVPDEYSSPEEPRFVPVSAELAVEIEEKGEVYRERPEKRKTV